MESTSKLTTLNITVSALPCVTSTMIATSTADQQASRQSTVETEDRISPDPTIQAMGFSTIVEGKEQEIPIVARGNSQLLDSPMIKLMEEYTGEKIGNDISTESWVNILSTVTDLECNHVERMEDRNKGITKYRLSQNLLAMLNRTSVELQIFVERATNLIEEWSQHFIVDPKDTLSYILTGTSSLPQLDVAWKMIQKHLDLIAISTSSSRRQFITITDLYSA